MNIRNVLLLGCIGIAMLASASSANADGLTVGLFLNTELAFDGYTLFTPIGEGNAYLIDNAGRPVHSWDKGSSGNLTPYLLEDDSVIRNDRGITRHAWDGSLLWDFEFGIAHHDIEVLPNGNVLLLVIELRTAADAIAEGRDPDTLNTGILRTEKIVEVRQTGLTSGEIVWEWHAWDHLIQDFDPAQDNFDVVGDHPELIDINFGETSFTSNADHDWLHANSVDYNAELDQIVISLRQFSELWIIDHSTTTEEAASHSGGTSERGGDILYRWGHPQAYRSGSAEDRQLFLQHDVQWIAPGLPGEGNLLMFNNGVARPDGLYSSVEEIVPPVDVSGSYPLSRGEAFGPGQPVWSYSDGTQFFSAVISGVGRLPNGNTLITSGTSGTIFEVTPGGETVWKYVNPLGPLGPFKQGDPVPTLGSGLQLHGTNEVYRSIRYAPDYPGLSGRNLTPGAPLEIGTDSDDDGLLDHEEAKIYGTDPFAADSDTDGLSDGDEVLMFGSDPNLVDTDGDGLSDFDEIFIYGSDPLIPALVGDVNCDGDVSSIDAALILQATAGLVAFLACGESADVNRDGATTSIDAALVLQFTAGLIPALPT